MVEVSLTVGKLDASLALLLTKDHHLIEFPTILLPDGISTGSIVKITCDRDLEKEKEEKKQFNELQEEIFEIFGKHEPENPVLKIVNVTQTSCVLEWDPLNLGTAELKELTLYKNGSKLGPIKNPFQKKNIKFSGLPIDTPYKFQLKLETSSGIYYSNLVELRTHKMTDLSGITVCIGDIDYNNEEFSLDDIENAIRSIGAKPVSNQVKVDTTQFVCTKTSGIEYQKAKNMNIPIIRPEWIKACQLERRIVGVNKFYLDTENPIWKTKDFWSISNDLPVTENNAGEEEKPEEKHITEENNIPNIVIHNDVQSTTTEEETQAKDIANGKTAAEAMEEPAAETVEEPAAEAVEEPAAEAVEEPAAEAVEEPAAEAVEEPTEEAAEEPVDAIGHTLTKTEGETDNDIPPEESEPAIADSEETDSAKPDESNKPAFERGLEEPIDTEANTDSAREELNDNANSEMEDTSDNTNENGNENAQGEEHEDTNLDTEESKDAEKSASSKSKKKNKKKNKKK